MAGNGILDYQGMNQAIYRGATSNIIVDTQSMSIEIGAGNSSHTSNLHIECDHAANVASIQLNSNVVTEFSRSKKLIKYPRVAMTSASQGGYVVSASSYYETNPTYAPWKAFDNIKDGNSWISENLSYNADGTATGASQVDTFETIPGSWLGIELPNKIKLEYVIIKNRDSATIRNVKDGIIWAKHKNESTWYRIHDFSGLNTDSNAIHTIHVNQTNVYDEYRLQFTKMYPYVGGGAASIGELAFYGTPEYDPEAHGTDVVVKSVANVPNTDWLEVYYDAKGETTMPNPVTDLAGGDQNGAVTGHSPTLDETGGIESFKFDGVDDYIESTLTNDNGAWIFSKSLWFKQTTGVPGANYSCISSIGDYSASDATFFYLNDTHILVSIYSSGAYFPSEWVVNEWTHAVVVMKGTTSSLNDIELYINGKKVEATSQFGTATPRTLPENAQLRVGREVGSGTNYFTGSIANFRLFNRALTSDEIYQLYAYQKEYFGHGDLSMTLKAGRLGIGTSEPRAALDVRGGAIIQSMISDTNGFYEEGTWTPYIAGSTSGVCYPSGSNYGWFIRVGNLVTIGGTVAWSGYSGAISGNRQIMGLPYPARNVPNARTAMTFGVASSTGLWNGVSSGTTFRLIIDPGFDFIYIASSNETAGQWSTYNLTPTIDIDGVIYGLGGTYRI